MGVALPKTGAQVRATAAARGWGAVDEAEARIAALAHGAARVPCCGGRRSCLVIRERPTRVAVAWRSARTRD